MRCLWVKEACGQTSLTPSRRPRIAFATLSLAIIWVLCKRLTTHVRPILPAAIGTQGHPPAAACRRAGPRTKLDLQHVLPLTLAILPIADPAVGYSG